MDPQQPPAPVSTIPPEPSLPHNPYFLSKRLIVLIAGFVILLLGVVTGIFVYQMYKASINKESQPIQNAQPSINPVSDNTAGETTEGSISEWKTYRNEEYGFEFEYPSDLKLNESKYQSGDFYIGLKREFILDPESYDNNFGMSIFRKLKDKQESLGTFFIREYCETIEQSAYTPNREQAINKCKDLFFQSKKDIKIDGKNAIQARNIDYVVERLITIVDNESEFLVFRLGESGEEGSGISDEALATYNQILSSFKFQGKDLLGLYLVQIEDIQAKTYVGYAVDNNLGGYFLIMNISDESTSKNITELAVWADEDAGPEWGPYEGSVGMTVELTTLEKGNVYVEFRTASGSSAKITIPKDDIDRLVEKTVQNYSE